MRTFLKWLGRGLLGLVVLIAVGVGLFVVIGSQMFDRQAVARVPAGYARNTAFYLTAKDGTKLAVDVWLPKDLAAGKRIPALIKGTPYWRARKLTMLGKAVATLVPALATEPDVFLLTRRGFAVVAVDARGTGASFGTLKIMFDDAEVSDYGTVADWIARQPWSDGKVGAYGFSYRGATAANIASLPNPSIKAVAPLFDLTDVYLLAHPGGGYAQYLLSVWTTQTRLLNAGKFPCVGVCQWLVLGPKPVDADTDEHLMRQAFAAHEGNYDVAACMKAAQARDDTVCKSGRSLHDVSLLARKASIEKSGRPMFVQVGWLDQTSPAQALHRFQTFSNPQELTIGPFTHGGFMSDDPFLPDRPLDLTYVQQTDRMADFFDRAFSGKPIAKSIRYYVNGAAAWKTSPTWPPAGVTTQSWFLAPSHTLSSSAPPEGTDLYKVDFGTSSGALSRHRGQVDVSKTDYGDRAQADKRLLAYTSAPLGADAQIAGDPVAHLKLASSAPDGLVIVYLEDVAPDGRVTYVSEGVLRLAHRKLAPQAANSADPLHTYLRADMQPMPPGAFEDVTLAISPIAALIRKGHRLRIAIAGADDGNLGRMPERGAQTFTLERGAGSFVEIPVAP